VEGARRHRHHDQLRAAGNYKTAGGLHGVGASVVNALSKELVATVKRDGATWDIKFKQGQPVGEAAGDLPATLRGLVAARLDSLTTHERGVHQFHRLLAQALGPGT